MREITKETIQFDFERSGRFIGVGRLDGDKRKRGMREKVLVIRL